MIPIIEGDSLAVQTAPFIKHIEVDAKHGRQTATGITRLLARKDLNGRVVLVSLGTNDMNRSSAWIAHEARLLLKRTKCVIWARTRIDRPTWIVPDTGKWFPVTDNINKGLESVTRLHLIYTPKPDAGDGVHLTPNSAKIRARRYVNKMSEC